MAKDDFHVIAYRILYYLYNCLKEGENPEPDRVSAEEYGINKKYFSAILKELSESGYIEGITVIETAGWPSVRVTPYLRIKRAGIEYLTDNSFMEKAKRFMQEVKSAIPFI